MSKKEFVEEFTRRQNERQLKKLAKEMAMAENEGKELDLKRYKQICANT